MSEQKPERPPDRSGEPRAYLGASRPPAEIDEATLSVLRRMHELTPRTFVVPAIVLVNVGVYVAMIAQGVHYLQPSFRDILAFGGNSSGVTTAGEWWRLLTCMFLHYGLVHLALNMWALWSVGRLVERLFGNVGFLSLYLGAGLCGSIASLLWNPMAVSAGASGAVFGVFGALIGIVLRMRRDLPKTFLKALTRDAAFVIVANLIFTFSVKDVDAAAHLGGLAAGALFGLVLAHPIRAEEVASRWKRAGVVLLAAGAIVLAGAFFAPTGNKPAPLVLEEVHKLEKLAVARYNAGNARLQKDQADPATFAKELEEEVLPMWRQARAKLAPLVARLGEAARLYAEYFTFRDEAWQRYLRALRATSSEAQKAFLSEFAEKNKQAEGALEAIKKVK